MNSSAPASNGFRVAGIILNWGRSLAGALLCAVSISYFIWSIHHSSGGSWSVFGLLLSIGIMFAPLAMLAWSVVAKSEWRVSSYIWVRRLIQFHIAAMFVLGLLAVLFGHLIAIAVILARIAWVLPIDLFILLLSPWKKAEVAHVTFYRYAVLLLGGGTFAGLFIWSYANIGIVAWQAEATADNRSYCLQVKGYNRERYRSVTSLMDLHGVRMQTPYSGGGNTSATWQWSYHAVLLVEADGVLEWWNWSYRQQRFVPTFYLGKRVITKEPPAPCDLKVNFVRQLPWSNTP